MSLSTISFNDFPPKVKRFSRPEVSSLKTDDIQGAKPELTGYRYTKKPNYSYSTSDIEKSAPSRLHQPLNRPYYSLVTDDIDKAKPCQNEFRTTRTGTNPLEPSYNLPKYSVRPYTPPKFIRDNINIDDIQGTKPETYYKSKLRDTMGVADIEGAKPVPEKQLKKPNFYDPTDILKGEEREQKTGTNPLAPEYKWRDEDGKLLTIGQVEGSKPRELVKAASSPHTRHLNNSDIEGSGSGTVGLGPFQTKQRNYDRNPTNNADIDGAHASTLPKGIKTMRSTNPLDPSYKWVTEETTQEVKKQQPKVPTDAVYTKNAAKFWGVTPPGSAPPAKPPVPPSRPSVNPELKSNLAKFYGASGYSTPDAKKVEFENAASKFYASGGRSLDSKFMNVSNPYSIHRPKPNVATVDPESLPYQKSLNQFYDSSGKATPNTSQFGKAATKYQENGNTDYQFGLSRNDLKSPGANSIRASEADQKKSYGPSPPSSAQRSQQLVSTGKAFIDS